MKYITHIIIIGMLVYIIGLVIGLAGQIKTVSNTQPLKEIIFKIDAELDQCKIDRDNYKYTVDKMAENCR